MLACLMCRHGSVGSSAPSISTTPGATNTAMPSTWPSVSVSSALPGSQITFSPPRVSRSSRVTSSRRPGRVAVGVQKTGVGGDDRALAIHRDPATLGQKGGFEHRQPFARRDRSTESGVLVEGRVLVAPGRKGEQAGRLASLAVDHEVRPCIARPTVIHRHFEQLDPAAQKAARLGGIFGAHRHAQEARTRQSPAPPCA